MLSEIELAKVQARSDESVRRFNANDATALGEMYTADAELLAPGLPRRTGRAAAEEFWRMAFATTKRHFDKIEPVLLQGDGAFVYEYANWLLSVTSKAGETSTQTGKNLLIWQNVDGTWLVKLDIWNTP